MAAARAPIKETAVPRRARPWRRGLARGRRGAAARRRVGRVGGRGRRLGVESTKVLPCSRWKASISRRHVTRAASTVFSARSRSREVVRQAASSTFSSLYFEVRAPPARSLRARARDPSRDGENLAVDPPADRCLPIGRRARSGHSVRARPRLAVASSGYAFSAPAPNETLK